MYFSALRIIILHLFHHAYITVKADVKNWKNRVTRLIDYGDKYNDVFFDKTVFFALDIANYTGNGDLNKTSITTGILLTNGRILTTYNPFRKIVRDKELISKTYALIFKGRTRYADDRCSYVFDSYKLKCGRQVVYFPDEDIPDKQWHGFDRRNSPVHDLMVLRMSENTALDTFYPDKYTWWAHWPPGQQSSYHPAGGFLTTIAKSSDSMGDTLKFASLGYRNDIEIKTWHQLHRTVYKAEDDLIVNCDEWLPREWGRFICVKNVDNFPGVGSGAMLFSGPKLFGLGCFAYFRGHASILVFTDIRPYYDLIMNTCTDADMKE